MVSKEGGVFAGEGLLDTPMSIFLVQVSVACGWLVGRGGGADTKEIRRVRRRVGAFAGVLMRQVDGWVISCV